MRILGLRLAPSKSHVLLILLMSVILAVSGWLVLYYRGRRTVAVADLPPVPTPTAAPAAPPIVHPVAPALRRRSVREFLIARWLGLVGIATFAAAIGLAFRAQTLLFPTRNITEGGLLYGAAAALAVVSMALLDRIAPLPESGGPTVKVVSERAGSRPRSVAATLLAIGFVALAVALYALVSTGMYSLAWWLWIAALILLTAAFAVISWKPGRPALPRLTASVILEIAVVIVILAGALALRITNVADIPPRVHADEATMGIEARKVLAGTVPNLFSTGSLGFTYTSYAISAASMAVFGNNLYGLRMGSVVLGTLSILLAYLVFKRLFSVRVAALTAFLTAVGFFDIHYGRDGLNNIQATFAALLLFYFALRGIETRRAIDFWIAGLAAGLCFDVYYAARLAPAIIGAYLLYKIISDRAFLRTYWPGIAVVGLGMLVFLGPMVPFYARNFDTLVNRTQGVFIFSPGALRHFAFTNHTTNPLDVLRIQTINTIEAFNFRGETSDQFAHNGAPLLDYWTSAVFVLGVALATLRPLRSRYFFVAVWFWATLIIGSILTMDPFFSPREVILLPVLFLFPALVIDIPWRVTGALFGRRGTYAFAVPAIAFCLLALQANYSDYFDVHVNKMQPADFYTVMSRYIGSINDRYRTYLLSPDDNSLKYATPHFLVPNLEGVDVQTRSLPLPLPGIPAEKGVAFIVVSGMPNEAQRLAAIRQAYPRGQEQVHARTSGVGVFTSYLVGHAELLAASPAAAIDEPGDGVTVFGQATTNGATPSPRFFSPIVPPW
jgi:4-amino-4-deoxy-L-arabinose transferase-like glycosyltransferase